MQMNVIHHFKCKNLFYLFKPATKPTFMWNFSNICALVLKASIDWPHQLTNSTSASSKNDVIAICNIILTILQSLVGFNQPSTTQWTKTLGNDLVFVESLDFESKKYISLRNFHEQQSFQLKTTIDHANERDSSFQMQKFVLSVQFSNKTHIFANFL